MRPLRLRISRWSLVGYWPDGGFGRGEEGRRNRRESSCVGGWLDGLYMNHEPSLNFQASVTNAIDIVSN